MAVTPVFVDCHRDDKIIATYELGEVSGLLHGPKPDASELIAHAQTNLTNERIAFPPYEGVTFTIRR